MKYCDIIDRREILFLNFTISTLCLIIISLITPYEFDWWAWLTITIIWIINFIVELIRIIKIWRKRKCLKL